MGRKNKQQFYEGVELLAGGGEGHALGKVNGKVVFVQYGAPGDIADIQVIGRKKRFDIAKINTLQKASELRVEPFCEIMAFAGAVNGNISTTMLS